MRDQWAILELLGHRRLVGLVSECEIAGSGFLRIDVMDPDGGFQATQYYAPGSVYCLTPTTEEAVRAEVEMRKSRPALTFYGADPFDDEETDDEPQQNDQLSPAAGLDGQPAPGGANGREPGECRPGDLWPEGAGHEAGRGPEEWRQPA